jgi:hypothetical protein
MEILYGSAMQSLRAWKSLSLQTGRIPSLNRADMAHKRLKVFPRDRVSLVPSDLSNSLSQ